MKPRTPPTPEQLQRRGAAAPLRTAWQLLAPLWIVAAAALLVVALAAGALRWMLFSEPGGRWLLTHLPGLQVEGFEGELAGPQWQLSRLDLRSADGALRLRLLDLRIEGLEWQWRPAPGTWLALNARRVQAREAQLDTGPPGERPIPAPQRVGGPFSLTIDRAALDLLRIDRLPPLRAIEAQGLVLAADGADARHRVASASAEFERMRLQAAGEVATRAPLALSLQVQATPLAGGDAPDWAAVLRARGELGRIDLQATVRGVPRGPHAAPSLDLRATLAPLLAWPVQALSLHTQDLDLAALSTAAPRTRLSGSAVVTSRAADAPIAVRAELANAVPGRWNEGGLPLRRLLLELSGRLDQTDRLDLTRFELQLADASQAAGRITGQGGWVGTRLRLQTALQGVVPQRLDGRAPAMVLAGPLSLDLQGLPAPDGSATPARDAWRLSGELDLLGRVDAAPQPVRLTLKAEADARSLRLDPVRAESGAASAELQLAAQRVDGGAWQLETRGQLVDFDPQPWWPGEPGSAWREGHHRLRGDWALTLRLPADAATLPRLALAQRVAGNGRLRLTDSLLAGVPLAAELDLASARGSALATLQGELRAGGNRLRLDGRAEPGGSGERDRWLLELQAGTLATLAPLARLLPALADWAPRAGSANGRLEAEGRWPALKTSGRAQLVGLQAGTLALAEGAAEWQLDTADRQSLVAQINLGGLALGPRRAQRISGELRGTVAEHRVDLVALLPERLPAAGERLLGVVARNGTQARLRAQGGWVPRSGGGGRWTAQIDQLSLGGWDGRSAPSDGSDAWARSQQRLRAELDFDAQGGLAALRADAGRITLGDAIALRWDEVRADLRGEQARFALRAELESFALAPLLQRLQPQLGWRGDLRIGGRLDLRADERFAADLVLERRGGDLAVQAGESVQALGLNELRLAIAAQNGAWRFEPLFRGSMLGTIEGSLRVDARPEQRWPGPDAPIGGEVRARVADIGIWTTFLPPGWRLGGEVDIRAGVGGRFAEPQLSGRVSGQGLALRNRLQGVHVADGRVEMVLEGDRARIERFQFKGGDGTLSLAGQGSLWRQVDGRAQLRPRATLRLQAERFRVLGRVDRILVASGQAEARLDGDSVRLDGKLKVDEGLYDFSRSDAPTLDEDITVRRPGEPEPEPPDPQAARGGRNVALALDLDLGDNLRVRGSGLDTRLAGQLRLSAPQGRLAVHGLVRTVEGSYAGYGQKMEIERGIVAFSGPYNDPRLDVLALRPNLDVRVGVQIGGTALSPRVRLYSDPAMGETEKLSWLVLGRAPDGLGRADSALLQRAAVALLAGGGEAPTDALMRTLGLDEFSVRQSDGDVRETVISLGKQLSRRWYVGYERGVNAIAGSWQLIYRIAQRLTVRAQSGLDNSIDVIWTWRLQETPEDAATRKPVIVQPAKP